MTQTKKTISLLPCMIVLLVALGLLIPMQIFTADNAYAGAKASYNNESYKSANHTSGAKAVRIFTAHGMKGTCCNPGVPARDSGKCDMDLKKDSGDWKTIRRIAYYYGVKKGWLNGKDVPKTQRLTYMIQYAKVGRSEFIEKQSKYQSRSYATDEADIAKKNIAAIPKDLKIPNTFVLYFCNAGSGDQNFVVWDIEETEISLVKKTDLTGMDPSIDLDDYPGYNDKRGIEYTVYDDSSCKDKDAIGVLKCNKNGKTNTLKVYPGTYYLKETKTNDYFKLNEKKLTAKPTKKKDVTVTGKDYPQLCEISLKKVWEKEPTEEAKKETFTFTLARADGLPIAANQQKIAVKGDGTPKTVTGLPAGEYRLDEVLTREQEDMGFKQESDMQTITLTPGKTASEQAFTMKNSKPTGRGLEIKKTVTAGSAAGFTFRVTAKGTENQGTITKDDLLNAAAPKITDKTTGEEVDASWDLPDNAIERLNTAAKTPNPGDYEVKLTATFLETPAQEPSDTDNTDPEGSAGTDPDQGADEGQTPEDGNTDPSDTVDTEGDTGNGEKVDPDTQGNENDPANDTDGQESEDSSGQNSESGEEEPEPQEPEEVSLDVIAKITLKENPSAKGSDAQINVKEARTEQGERYDITLNDIEWLGALKPLAIYKGKTEIYLTTKDNGWAYMDGEADHTIWSNEDNTILPPGTYTIEEIMTEKQQARYLQPKPQTVVLSEGLQSVKTARFTNKDNPVKVTVKKESDDGEIEGIEFRLTGKDFILGDIERVKDTNSKGEIDFGNVYGGDFVIEETGFDPTKYRLDDKYKEQGYTIPTETIHVDGNTDVDTQEDFAHKPVVVNFVNKKIPKLFITKVDKDTGDFLRNAEFELYENGTEKVARFALVQNDDGSAGIKMYEAKDGITGRYAIENEEEYFSEDLSEDGASDEENSEEEGSGGEGSGQEDPDASAEASQDEEGADSEGTDEEEGSAGIEEPEEGVEYAYAVIEGLEVGAKYTLKETKPPAGYCQFFSDDFEFEDGKQIVVTNANPKIGTTATDKETGLHQANADGKVTIVDTVKYSNIAEGKEYEMVGSLVYKGENNSYDVVDPVLSGGKPVEVKKTFTAGEGGNGTVDMEFTVDGTALEGRSVVVFEELYDRSQSKNNQFVTSHSDVNDEGQTVDIPKVRTTAVNTATGTHQANAKGDVTIKDAVSYENLLVGKEYTVKGTLMDKASGKAIEVNGKPVTAEAKFTAAKTSKDAPDTERVSGTVDLTFTFPAKAMEGRSAVAFEELYTEGKLIGEHEDLTDEDQTVDFPKVRTSAAADDTGMHVTNADNEVTITDTVRYENLLPGKAYTMSGVLMDRKTGKEIVAGGKPVMASAEFETKAGEDPKARVSGTVQLKFTFPAKALEGTSIVAFEELYADGKVIGEHKDVGDEEQTVDLPKIRTNATAEDTGMHVTNANQDIVITDTVSYENLLPETEYKMSGVLVDKETGKPIKADGAEVRAESAFTTAKAAEGERRVSGQVKLRFVFPGKEFEGKSVVAFEELTVQGKLVGEHKDPNDEDQTVDIPKVRTTAVNTATGTHQANAKGDVTIKDTVKYENLLVGKEYTVKGTLMDKASGKAIETNGKPVTAEARFTAAKTSKDAPDTERVSGTVDLTFTFPAKAMEGRSAVAFEELYTGGKLIGEHKDPNDEDQTVDFPKVRTSAAADDTGMHATNADDEVTITDTVKYENLLPGKAYTMSGVLMDRKTGKEIVAGGKPVMATAEFKPKAGDKPNERVSGTVQLKFTFPAKALEGTSLVAFEELYADGKVIGEHKDINDEEQTVDLPRIRTNATAEDTGMHVTNANQDIVITDTVTYENLLPETEYKMSGVLVDKETGEPIKADGAEVRAESPFTTAKAAEGEKRISGQVKLRFVFPGKEFEGKSVVAFEELTVQGKLIGEHKDPNDEDQTVDIPKIRTNAVGNDTRDHITMADGKVAITDTVSFENLIVGQIYTMKGILMDKETGEPLEAADGEVSGEVQFIPTLGEDSDMEESVEDPEESMEEPEEDPEEDLNTPKNSIVVGEEDSDAEAAQPQKDAKGNYIRTSGRVQIKFVFDGSDLAGATTVAFEELYIEDKLIGEHKDIEDEEQTVELPEIGTTAERTSTNVIVDTVSYSGLIPGKTYVMSGVLVNKDTGKKIPGSLSEKEFTPRKPDGEVKIKFNVNAKEMGNRDVVVFEECYFIADIEGEDKPVPVAEHKDIDDEAQTVNFSVPPKTGQSLPWILISIGIVAVLSGAYVFRNRKKLFSKNK